MSQVRGPSQTPFLALNAPQAPALGFHDTAVRAGAFRMRYVGGYDPDKVDPDDTFERDSFCQSDNESLVYEDATSSQQSL